jgi:hypothetical protein
MMSFVICALRLYTNCYKGDDVKEDVPGGSCSTYRETGLFKILVEKFEGKRPIERQAKM